MQRICDFHSSGHGVVVWGETQILHDLTLVQAVCYKQLMNLYDLTSVVGRINRVKAAVVEVSGRLLARNPDVALKVQVVSMVYFLLHVH